jgi:hypothetical protein
VWNIITTIETKQTIHTAKTSSLHLVSWYIHFHIHLNYNRSSCFFSIMESTTALIFALACFMSVYVTTTYSDQCLCACCGGAGCTPVKKPAIPMALCINNSCMPKCIEAYPNDCTGLPVFTATSVCMSDASQFFSRYTTLGAFSLAYIVTVLLRN